MTNPLRLIFLDITTADTICKCNGLSFVMIMKYRNISLYKKFVSFYAFNTTNIE